MSRSGKYREFCFLYSRAYSNLTKEKAWTEATTKWNSLKMNGRVDEEEYKNEVVRLEAKIQTKKKNLFDFMIKPKKKALSCPGSVAAAAQQMSVPSDSVKDSVILESNQEDRRENILSESNSELEDGDSLFGRKYESPAQQKMQGELNEFDKRLASLNQARNLGIGEENVNNMTKQIKVVAEKRKKVAMSLKRLKNCQRSQKKYREKKKRIMKEALKAFPSHEGSSVVRDNPGRPSLDDIYCNLHHDILHIASIGAAASDKRRDDLIRSVKTLDDLHKALEDLNYKISRSALYLHLLPKSAHSSEGKKHVKTVPVRYILYQGKFNCFPQRLVRPENSLRKKHIDRPYAAATYNSCFEIVETLGILSISDTRYFRL